MSSLIEDFLLKGKRSLTAEEYATQSVKVKELVARHQDNLNQLKKLIEENPKIDQAGLHKQELAIAEAMLSQIKPHIFTEKERQNLRKSFFTNNDVEKEEHAYFDALKGLDQKLMKFNSIYNALEKNIKQKLASKIEKPQESSQVVKEEKQKFPPLTFDKERKESTDKKAAILERLKAKGAVSTPINPTGRPRA